MSDFRRYSRIAMFALRYRRAGVLRGVPGPVKSSPRLTPQRFVDDLEALGPAFIKMGQALSGRPDLVNPDYLAELARIQDDVTPISVQAVRRMVTVELGQSPEQLFRHFDPVPLAAGSLAQVHAVTLPDGDEAVIKVQRPGIARRIRHDLNALERMAIAAQRHTEVGRRYGFVHWIAELRRSLLNELDFVAEADHLRTFASNLGHYDALDIPVPYMEFTTARVLTMARVRGEKLPQDGPLPGSPSQHVQQASQLLCAYIDQVFVHGLVHADPHPGNLVLMDDGRLALLDFGMVTGLSPSMRRDLLRLMMAAADGDAESVSDICEHLCSALPELDRLAYRRAVSNAVMRYATAGERSTLEEGRLLLALTVIGADNGLRPPAELSLLGRALLNLEPAVARLAPHLPVRELVRSRLNGILMHQLSHPLSAAQSGALLLDAQRLALDAPGHMNTLLRTLADNRFKVRLDGLEESHLIENLQKIANRISAGVITAALLIAGALVSRSTRAGYGWVAAIMFGLAGLIGLVLVANSMRRDRAPRDDSDAGVH
ncbi:ABC1 kinase family protein [Dyella sp.]|uniref:ABC1 kinase family protein n=1 Tax=Dyella sp. TaxID=1869338 RepID=UPI002ED604B3